MGVNKHQVRMSVLFQLCMNYMKCCWQVYEETEKQVYRFSIHSTKIISKCYSTDAL